MMKGQTSVADTVGVLPGLTSAHFGVHMQLQWMALDPLAVPCLKHPCSSATKEVHLACTPGSPDSTPQDSVAKCPSFPFSLGQL